MLRAIFGYLLFLAAAGFNVWTQNLPCEIPAASNAYEARWNATTANWAAYTSYNWLAIGMMVAGFVLIIWGAKAGKRPAKKK